MDTKPNLNIIVIDDNLAIHNDFRKILTDNHTEIELQSLEKSLFGLEDEPSGSVLPSFQIDTALQGQNGVKLIEKALKEGRPYSLAFVDIR
ncbi:MAG: hypothetical protein H0U57_12545, partial [Tatlockia sp.]|nr:hypothetical protein [Tatlockia sp.]